MVDPEYDLGVVGRMAAVVYGTVGYTMGGAAAGLIASVNPIAGAAAAAYVHHQVGKRFKAAWTGDSRDWFGDPGKAK